MCWFSVLSSWFSASYAIPISQKLKTQHHVQITFTFSIFTRRHIIRLTYWIRWCTAYHQKGPLFVYFESVCANITSSIGDSILQCGMWLWNHDSEFTQVTAPCNVIRGSGMTCRWIRPVAAPCNVTRSSGIMTLNSPSGSTLQCGRWLWDDDMPWNSPKRPPYWKSTSGFDFDHITAVDISFCTLRKSKSDNPQQKRWRYVDFQNGGSQSSWILRVQ